MTDSCPCCSSATPTKTLRARELTYRLCSHCGSGQLMTLIDFEEYYRDYFPQGVREDSPVLEARYRAILTRLREMATGHTLLEVGCGNGQLLAVAREMGWEVAGTEVSHAQVQHCRQRGLRVEYGDLVREGLFSHISFDAAVLIEVFEHVPDPVDLLRGIGKRLPSGGMLYLTTPNFNALSRRILGGDWSVLNREHVTLATARGLGLALKEAGFQALSIRSRNLNVAEIRYHLRARRRSGSSSAQDEKAPPLNRPQAAAELRDRIEASPPLQFLKGIVNAGLGLTGSGDTLVAWARKGG